MSIARLPNELLIDILLLLDDQSLQATMRACNKFYVLATSQYFIKQRFGANAVSNFLPTNTEPEKCYALFQALEYCQPLYTVCVQLGYFLFAMLHCL